MDIPSDQLKIWTEGNWEEKRYEYFFYAGERVIDLGAYQGEFAEKIHEKYGVDVVCVEPTSAIINKGRHWCTVINKAAWVEDGVRSFGGSAYWTSANEGEKNQSYPCFDILKILQEPVALLKINIEGDEYEVLNRILESGLQENIGNFQIQFHQIPGYKILYSELTQELSKTHKKTWGVDWVWENWEKL